MADLWQGHIWTDARGRDWRLEDMSAQHRRRVLALLRRNAPALLEADVMAYSNSIMAPRGDEASADWDRAVFEWASDPGTWLEELPFVVALRELVAADAEVEQGCWPWP